MIKRIVTALALVPVVLLLVLRAPLAILALITGVVALLAVREFLQLAQAYGVQPFWCSTYIYCGLLFLLISLDAGIGRPLLSTGYFLYAAAFLAALSPFVFLTIGMRREPLSSAYPAAAASSFAFAYVALPMAFLVQLRQQWAGAILVIYLLLVVWSGDIFAYFVGKAAGRHRMSPRVSPKKTWEGAAASVVFSTLIGTAWYYYALPISTALLGAHLIQRRDGMFGLERPAVLPIVALSIVLNIAAQLGDLVESLIKRGAGVKDSGSLLPGHGGMLDRIDALLFAAPVMWAYVAWRVMQ